MTRSESGGFNWKAEGWGQAPEGSTAMVPEGVCRETRVGGGRRNWIEEVSAGEAGRWGVEAVVTKVE